MHVKVMSILLLMLFIGSCKWWFKAEAEGGVVTRPVEDIKVVAARAVEEVSKATGRSAAEVKSLSKDDLDKIAAAAKASAEATYNSTNDNKEDKKKKSEFIDEIKESAGKMDLAFKSLVGAGYTGDLASPVLGNIKNALGRLELAKKLAEIEESGDSNTLDKVKRAAKALGVNESCVNNIDGRQGYANAVKGGLKECIKNLMDHVNSDFDRGVRAQLDKDQLGDVPEKFKDAFDTLRGAAHKMQQAASKVQHKY
ncbi:hypothetical protein [Borrelia sp. RT5S]|uniref:hypothetical protein n=1 Tax=Borrelia sp. RT5S TaxID=2898581 RepID=UPI001E4582E3|nr:hypothetical protein [Borrelia sp. RT5S]UGQ16733.1 hypothetical protein LSO06_05280 [Borrelia sp. RT5S]